MKILQVFMALFFLNGLFLLVLSWKIEAAERYVKYVLFVSGVFLMSVAGALFRVFAV